MSGSQLRADGINRIGNLLVPNDNYCQFEDWIMPILDKMVDEQNADPANVNWTPSKIINRLGKEINNQDSVYYWAYKVFEKFANKTISSSLISEFITLKIYYKNSIPVYSPALTDGSLGDMMYFHSYRKPGLKVDILEGNTYLIINLLFSVNLFPFILRSEKSKQLSCSIL